MQEGPLGEFRVLIVCGASWWSSHTSPRRAISFLQYHIGSSLTPRSLGLTYTHYYV